MKRILISAILLSNFALGFAQSDKTTQEDQALKTWYHDDYAKTKIYGVNTEKAYQFLESKGLKPQTVIVGVLDSGVEVDHPGLIKNVWTNTKEIPDNGIDDDHNGYVDDIHGWNFIGGKNGDVDVDNLEVTRIVRQYKPIFEGENSAQNKANQAKMPKEFASYMKAKEQISKKLPEVQRNYEFYKQFNDAIPKIVGVLNGKDLTTENLAKITPKDGMEANYVSILSQIASDPELKDRSPKAIEALLGSQVKDALEYYEPQATKQYSVSYDPRSIVGDNYADLNEKYYGNNHYEGPDAKHGTHVAGIIAGYPQNNDLQYGVASRVAKIMSVRTVPNGDERDKDVANSVIYAVDNGAKVLNMSFGKSISPNKEKVWDAFKYAESKGVLLVHAAGNDNADLAVEDNFPTNFKSQKDEKPFISNMITIGASTNESKYLRADFSNYNKKMVDVFAPGEKIYSTVPDAKYEYLQGTSMASPVVAGCAAVLLAYMPNLTPAQVIDALVKTVNVSYVTSTVGKGTETKFNLLSRSGGVVDLYKAAQYAYDNYYKKSGTTTIKPVNKIKKQRNRVK